MSNLKSIPITYSIYRGNDNPVFGESVTLVSVDDEAGGAFIILRQLADDIQPGQVRLDIDELELIYKTAKKMLKNYPDED